MSEEQPQDLLDYSVYLLDARGRIQSLQRLTAASEECAIWKLSQLEFSHTAELWRRGRRLACLGRSAGHDVVAADPTPSSSQGPENGA